LVRTGDIIYLDVKMTLVRYSRCYVSWGWDDSLSMVVKLFCLMLRFTYFRYW